MGYFHGMDNQLTGEPPATGKYSEVSNKHCVKTMGHIYFINKDGDMMTSKEQCDCNDTRPGKHTQNYGKIHHF
jgi:hypothetical protein